MTEQRRPVDDPTETLRILAQAKALLLDFDGPVCSVFAGFPAPLVADQLRKILLEGQTGRLPDQVASSEDPFDVYKYAATLGPDEASYVEAALRAHEVDAVSTAQPTPGAHDLIREWCALDREVAIVSNNSTAAVEAYLDRFNLAAKITYVAARSTADPAELKPSSDLLDRALLKIDAGRAECVFIGDADTDIRAAQTANVPIIAYANKPGKIERFLPEHPAAIVQSIDVLNQAVQGIRLA